MKWAAVLKTPTCFKLKNARASGGYTIFEVMIVLLITTAIFTSILVLFQGSNANSQFQQGINDLNSKLQTSIKSVNSELFPQTEQYRCSTNANIPTLSALPPQQTQEQGTNQDCIYLGRAFQVSPNANNLFIYTVLGNRTSGSNGQTVTDFLSAKPTPMVESGVDLTETYSTSLSSIQLKYAHVNGGVDEADMVGFYNNLGSANDSQNQAGSNFLYARGYKILTDTNNTNIARRDGRLRNGIVKNCIGEASNGTGSLCGTASPPHIEPLSNWQLCFVDNSGAQSALITVTTTSNAVQSVVKFKGC